MPKYYEFKVCGYYLYYTSHCIIEAMHVHASDKQLREAGSAKLFVKKDGSSVIQNRGVLSDRDLAMIQKFIKNNYQEMYMKWSEKSNKGYYMDTDSMER